MKPDAIRLVLDLETSSQNRHRCGIVEIAAAWVHHHDPLKEAFQMKCRPRRGAEIDADAIDYNGSGSWITDTTVKTEKAAVAELAWWIHSTMPEEARGLDLTKGQGLIMVGWNIGVFDWVILQKAWPDHPLRGSFPFSFRTLDLHSMAVSDMERRGIHVPITGLTSELVCEVYGIEPEPKPHRAINGVRFESQLYQKLMQP